MNAVTSKLAEVYCTFISIIFLYTGGATPRQRQVVPAWRGAPAAAGGSHEVVRLLIDWLIDVWFAGSRRWINFIFCPQWSDRRRCIVRSVNCRRRLPWSRITCTRILDVVVVTETTGCRPPSNRRNCDYLRDLVSLLLLSLAFAFVVYTLKNEMKWENGFHNS